jgi:hypothetical protein
MATESQRTTDDELPDSALFWRWVGKATRPVIGWILVGIGALLILIGWFGVSREAIVAKQLPYLISGGVGGVMFTVIGAYFLGTEELRKDSGRLDRLERQMQELHAALLSRPDAPALDTAAEFAPEESGSGNGHGAATKERLVVLPGGDRYHRRDCAMVEGKSGASSLAPSSIKRRGLEPCPLCEPVTV